MKLYVIRHKKTGNIMPVEYVKRGSYWDGIETCYVPRLFESRISATNFITNWVRGYASRKASSPNQVSIGYTPCGRQRSDVEVLEAEIIIGERP